MKDGFMPSLTGRSCEPEDRATAYVVDSAVGGHIGLKKEYFFYPADGAVSRVPSDYWSDRGLIWGEYEGTRKGVRSFLGFFVGSKEQYRKHKFPTIN